MIIFRNIVANGLSNFIQMLLPIVVLPVIYRTVGAEQYGLISFFSLLQVLIQMLDTGFGQTVTREIGRFNHAPAPDAAEKQANLIYTLQFIYIAIGVAGATVLCVAAPFIVHHWINAPHLPASELVQTIYLVAIVLGLSRIRFFYGAVLQAVEKAHLNAVIGTSTGIISALASILAVLFVAPTANAVVWSNVVVAVASSAVLYAANKRFVWKNRSLTFDLSLIASKLSFTVQNIFAVALGTTMPFLDKVYVSAHFPLSVLGDYNLVAALALVMTRPLVPIATAIYPRLMSYHANDQPAKFRDLFESTWQGMNCLVMVCLWGTIFFGADIITALTGKADVGERYHLVLVVLSLAAALNGAGRTLFLVQLCHGDSRTTLWVNIFSFALYFPALSLTIGWLGIAAPAVNAALIQLAALIALLFRTDRLFGKSLLWGWIGTSLLPQLVVASIPMGLVRWLLPHGLNVWATVVAGMIAGSIALASAICVSPNLRRQVVAVTRNLSLRLRRSYS